MSRSSVSSPTLHHTRNSRRMDLTVVIQTIVELPFWLFLFMVRILRTSPVVRQCYNTVVEFAIHTIQRLLQDPIIQESIAATISEGMNRFVQQPDLDQLLLHMVTSISKSQPDIARQQGQDFPIVVSSFVQGIIQHAVHRKSPLKVSHQQPHQNHHHNNHNHNKPTVSTTTSSNSISTTEDNATTPQRQHRHQHQQQLSQMESNTETISTRNMDGEDRAAVPAEVDPSSMDDTPNSGEEEILHDHHHLMVTTTSSSSSMVSVTEAPTEQLDDHAESPDPFTPLPHIDECNNPLLPIDDDGNDGTVADDASSMMPIHGKAISQSDRSEPSIIAQTPDEHPVAIPSNDSKGPSLLQFPFFGRPR